MIFGKRIYALQFFTHGVRVSWTLDGWLVRCAFCPAEENFPLYVNCCFCNFHHLLIGK